MRNRLLFLFFMFLPSILFAQQVDRAADSLAQTDQLRPIDFVQEDVRWNTVSTDLFSYWIDNGYYGMYGPQPKVFIDGLPVDANFFGWQNLNMLPIANPGGSTYRITPDTYHGRPAPAGYIDFQSLPVDTGFSVNASVYLGNETGDPGPYAYDSTKITPNVDRWGPDVETNLSYRKGGWYSRGMFVYRKHFPTDLISKGRLQYTASLLGTNRQYVNHLTYITTMSGLAETGYQGNHWSVRGRATYGNSKDYIFLQPFGREVPAETDFRQFSVQGKYRLSDWLLTGRYTGRQKTIDKRIDLHTYIFNWDQRSHQVAFSADYSTGKVQFNPGITYEYLKTMAPGLSQATDNLFTFFVKAAYPIGPKSTLATQLNADINGDDIAKTLRLSLPSLLTSHWSIKPAVMATEVLPVRQHSFGYWVNRGYTFADELDIPMGPVSVKKNRLTELSLQNDIALLDNLDLTIEPKLITHHALNVPFQPVEAYEFVTDTQPGIFSVTREEGSRLVLYAKIKHTFDDILTQSFSVNYQYTLDGTARYHTYFKQIPETKLQYQLDFQPVQSLMISLNTLYRTSTNWEEFAAIEGNQYRSLNGIPIREVTGTFHTKTPAFVDVSLSAKKWFWDRKLSTQFTVKNLLNDDLRMHPLGAELSTKFDVQVKMNF